MAHTNATSRVLAVDEDPTLRHYFSLMLAKAGYEVDVASTAGEARHRIESGLRYDCALVDCHLLEGTGGLAFVEWCKAADPDLAAVVVSVNAGAAIVDECMRVGAAGFLEKPPAMERIQTELGRAIERTRSLRHLHVVAANARDLGTAQRSLLHSNLSTTNSRNVQAFIHPKHEAGGDAIFTFRPTPHQQLVLVSDVSGHDLRAAFTGAYFLGLVRGMIQSGASVLDTLNQFNNLLVAEWQADPAAPCVSMSVTALLLDSRSRCADVITCGAPSPYMLRASGEMMELGSPSCPLGWVADELPPVRSYHFAAGDQIWLWTDGLTDLAEQLGVHPLSLAHSLKGSAEAARPGWLDAASDDVLVARVLPPGDFAQEPELTPVFHRRYGRQGVAAIDSMQEGWRASLALALPDLDEEKLWEVLLCAREVVLNGCQHGCRDEEDEADFRILHDRQGRFLRLLLDDPGAGHDFEIEAWEQKHQLHPVEHHRGLLLIKHLAQRMEQRRRGASLLVDLSTGQEGLNDSQNR